MTITLISLLKRRAGMTREAFVDHYEMRHRLIGEQVLGGWATRYVRRHLQPVAGDGCDHDYDVILEIDFPDRATMDACFTAMREPATAALIAEDEELLFDRSRSRSYCIDEYRSDLPPVAN